MGNAIRIYKKAVQESLKELRKGFYLSVLNICAIFVLVLASVFLSNLAGILTSLGLGGTNAATEGSNWIKTAKAYLKDTGKLRRTVSRLEHDYALCASTDDQRLDEVANRMANYYDDLESASK